VFGLKLAKVLVTGRCMDLVVSEQFIVLDQGDKVQREIEIKQIKEQSKCSYKWKIYKNERQSSKSS